VLLAKTLRSSTFKISLIFIAVFGAIVIALFAYVYSSTASYVLNRFDRGIEIDRTVLMSAYKGAGHDGLIAAIDKFIADTRFEDSIVLLADPSLAPIAGNLASWPQVAKDGGGWGSFGAERRPGAGPSSLRAIFETLPDGSHLLVGKDLSELDQVARKIYIALALVLLLIFVIAVVAAVAVTRRTVGRIESINTTSRAIMQSGLGERVPLCGSRDEWDQLAENLNSMFDRIELLMGEVKEATDNVAHDLRTPLTRVRGRLEKACLQAREPESDQQLIIDTIAGLDDVLRMFSSLTRIAQIEAARRTSTFRPVDLIEIAESVVELFDAAAENKNVRIKVIGDRSVRIIGDRDLLFDAVANLVDNAIKHGRESGQVAVELSRSGGGAVIAVSDDGPGIPADEHQHVFRRFYRLEQSRCTPGNGLGLSLVAAVARVHNARVKLLDNAPGLKVELQFPSS